MLHSSKNATCQEKETESITRICNYKNKACVIIRIMHASNVSNKYHALSSKLVTHPNVYTKSFKLGLEEPWEIECSSNSDATE